jgi:hypothetical protein
MENKEYSNERCGMCGGDCGQCGEQGMRCERHGMGCRQMHGMGCGGRHLLLRLVLGLAILAFVFGAGVKLGELKERMVGGQYGYGGGYGMMQRGYAPDVYANRGGMMQGWLEVQKPATTR